MQAIEEKAKTAYLTPEEVAEVLNISITSVYRRIRDKSIPSRKIGRLYRVSRRELVDVGLLE